jgi:hypothetical protein
MKCGCNIGYPEKPAKNHNLWLLLVGKHKMLIRRLIFGALMTAARNPAVQKKAGEVAHKALDSARPNLLKASRNAGVMTRKAKQKINDITGGR